MPSYETEKWYQDHQAWLRGDGGARANLTGVDLRGTNLHGANLRGTNLSRANLSRTNLSRANLREADLTEADLTGANLRVADLTGAIGLPAVPVVEEIDAKILAIIEAGDGILNMSAWHCGTTHCRYGWAIHLAGEAGYELERNTSSYLAGRLIYEASRPGRPAPDPFCSDEEAMADLRSV